MNKKRFDKVALTGLALGAVLLGGSYAGAQTQPASQSNAQTGNQNQNQPAFQSSVQVSNQNESENGEAAMLASQAKIDAMQATSAAVAKVPGTVLKVALDNENGNLVYSVEIKTAKNGVKDVKVDAGNATVLGMDAGDGDGEDNGTEQEGNSDGDQEDNQSSN